MAPAGLKASGALPSVRPASKDSAALGTSTLEPIAVELDTFRDVSYATVFAGAAACAATLSSGRWALLLASNGESDLSLAASAGFSASETPALTISAETLSSLPIVSLNTQVALRSTLPGLARVDNGSGRAYALLRFGTRAFLLMEGRYADKISGRIETSIAAFGFRVDEALERCARRRRFSGCSGASLGDALIERMDAANASFAVLMAFDAASVLNAWTRNYGADPARVISDFATIADSILSDTGGACLSGERYVLAMVLTNSPPDPELVSAQLARSLARAIGALSPADLPLARFLVVNAADGAHSQGLKAFLEPLSPKG